MLDASDLRPPPTAFPLTLESPSSLPLRSVPTPPPSLTTLLLTTPTPIDLLGGLALALAFYLGPDFMLAPLGIAGNARLGLLAESAVGSLICPADEWVADRKEGLDAPAPLPVQLLSAAGFAAAGFGVERLLWATLEDSSFVLSLGICSCLGGGLYELIRPPLPNRTEADLASQRRDEFAQFAAVGISPGSSCHESEIVRAFRRTYGKYRSPDAISDAEICRLLRQWARRTAGIERSPSGFYKGLVVEEVLDVFR